MNRYLKFVLFALGAVVVLFAGLVLALCLVESPEYARRLVSYGESDTQDYKIFPERLIENSPPVFEFATSPEAGIPDLITYPYQGGRRQSSLEALMEATATTAFIILRDDTILYDGYFSGAQRDSINTSFSVAKSFNSALVGIAIDEGFIAGVNEPVTTYLPELHGRGLEDVTIRHLLTMSSGIHYRSNDEIFFLAIPFGDASRTYYSPDMRKVALGVRPDAEEPIGTYFRYNNYYPLLEGLILERTTGRSVSAYLQEKIWEPLGMEYPASWSLDSQVSGFEKMESGINARAIDYLRFGRLFLRNGNWNGRQLISSQWVLESTSPDPQDQRPFHTDSFWKERDGYYQYHWWGLRLPDGGYDYLAWGHLGQVIYISPG